MNQEEKDKIRELILKRLMDFRGTQKDKIEAKNYVNIDRVGESIAGTIIQGLELNFDIKSKEQGKIRWEE